jgi:hypothetical protein
MIITRIDTHDSWVCLARRGMLMSETESIEYCELSAGEAIAFVPTHGVDEMVIVLEGHASVAGNELMAGTVALIPWGFEGSLCASINTRLIYARVLPEAVSSRLPPRIPELPENERAI